jgi:hypothetical protein
MSRRPEGRRSISRTARGAGGGCHTDVLASSSVAAGRRAVVRFQPVADGAVRALWSILDGLGRHSPTRERRALRRINGLDEGIFPELVVASCHHPNAFARAVAVRALARFCRSARRPVLRALHDPAMAVRLAALLTLDRMWSPAVAPAVIGMLKDGSPSIRANAAVILARHGVRRATPWLIRNLRDPQWYVRQHAARALGILGARRARSALQRAVCDPRKAVREAAAEALTRMRWPL